MAKKKDDYDIQIKRDLEGVRQNPWMYIGNVEDGTGFHHMLMEVLDNSVDEYMAGHCDKISVCLHKDGSASVSDNGRGIPTYYIKEEKMTALEAVLTILHAGGKFDKKAYAVSGGLHGVGVSVVNALSARLKAIVRKSGKEYSVAYEKGKKVDGMNEKGGKGKGTTIRFAPDLDMFKGVKVFDANIVIKKLRELSFLCRGLNIDFIDERTGQKESFESDKGLKDFVEFLAPSNLMDEPVDFTQEVKIGEIKILTNVGFSWLEGSDDVETIECYTNNIPNRDGGSHLVGFKAAMTRTINGYIASSDLPKSLKISLSGDDIREGLVAIISIRHPDAKFSSQTKEKLVSEDARTAVESVVASKLMDYLNKNPAIAKKVITRCVNAYKAREAAKKAKEAVKKSILKEGGILLPGKLTDCSLKDPELCEIFIVEGNSAGGSCKQGRNREFQAVLPLRGKVLNIEKSEFSKMMSNKELAALITAIGTGIGRNIDLSKLRYNKVIILCDADVDGSHIRSLLLTFFFRQMPQLIESGHVYVGRPPLYRINYRGNSYYLNNDRELNKFVKERNFKGKVQRFKGLGEMNPEQLWETTLNPNTRKLLRVEINDYLEADRIFGILMGKSVELRKEFIEENSSNANLDI
jgi:DNA gyrase subunit B